MFLNLFHLEINIEKYPEIQQIMETGKAVIINDVYNGPILFSIREMLSLIDIKSIMAFPIAYKDTLIGTLILRTSRREAPFNEREIRFCDVISNLSASPLKNAYLFEIIHKKKEQEREKRFVAEKESKASKGLLEIICQTQSRFILDADPRHSFDNLLNSLLTLTQSEYGFIGEVFHPPEGAPYLKTQSITNISWNEETKVLYDKHQVSGMEFRNMKTLFGAAITTGKHVISNDPAADPRRGGLPMGHPPLNSFLGLTFFRGKNLVGMVGIANRPEGYDTGLVEYLEPFLAICSNIIEAVRNERDRKETEDQLRKLSRAVKQSPSVVVITDTKGCIEYVNPKFTETTGFTQEEAMGKNPRVLKSGKTPPEEYKRLWETIKSGGEWRGKFCNKKKNGDLYWEAASISSMVQEKEVQLRKTFSSLQEKSMYLDNILRSATDYAIATTDLNFRITYYNTMAEKLHGYKAEQVIGKTVQEIHTGENVEQERFERALEGIRKTGEHRYLIEKKIIMEFAILRPGSREL